MRAAMTLRHLDVEDLPDPPRIELELDRAADTSRAREFLRLNRAALRARFPNGVVSETFFYDIAERALIDAVVVLPHFLDAKGVRRVVLRSSVRPPVALRSRDTSPIVERAFPGNLWEAPAGLVEEDERSEHGLRACAARELMEEVGATVAPDDLQPLGPSTFPCPGVIGERHFFFHVQVDPRSMVAPPEDGSVLERQAAISV